MQTTIALLGLAAVAYAVPQASLAPSAPAPAGCSPSYSGTFILNVVNTTTTKRDLTERQSTACPASGGGTLVTTLSNGKITDSQNRIGEVVANYQFQFDPQPQPGAVYTSGFSACSNGSLALGGSTVFYACNTGGFYNLYDRSIGQQCSPILLTISPCGSGSAPAPVSQKPDGQPTGTSVGVVSQKSDGQPTGTAVAPKPVSQISDGQIQATTVAPRPSAPVSQISDGQVQASTAIRLSQISDGQVQVPTARPSAPVSQISDGQIQATTAAPKPSAPVSQISDGQIQATTAAPKPSNPVSQISDGQVQATTAAPKPSNPVSQISDGQIQATGTTPSNVTATGKPAQVTANSANTFTTFGSQLAAIVVGVAAVALL